MVMMFALKKARVQELLIVRFHHVVPLCPKG